jgi:hypothetical protein
MIKQLPLPSRANPVISYYDYQNILNSIFKQEEKFDASFILPVLFENLNLDQEPRTVKILIDILYALAVLCPQQVKQARGRL